ncbi:MAG: sulfite exporter TauE/SafE family protein [Gammaproteobacteria bacterium]|nr:sulfite exporter TauE/SafE family protein [Gammaproteobacteria bacterium]
MASSLLQVDAALAFLIFGALAVGLAVGASGFGDALVGSAIWLHAYPPQQTVALVLLASLVVHAVSFRALRADFSWSRSTPFLISGLVGVPAGAWLLQHIDPSGIKTGLGFALVAMGVTLLIWAPRPFARIHRQFHYSVGVVGGVMGGFAGLSGVVPTFYANRLPWTKGQQRALYQPFIFVMNLSALLILAAVAGIDDVVWLRFAIALPVLIFGWWCGLQIYARINDHYFRRCVLLLLVISGAALAL